MLKIQRFLQNNEYWDRMLTAIKAKCFIFAYTNLANSFFRSRLFSTELPIAQISDKIFFPFHRLQMEKTWPFQGRDFQNFEKNFENLEKQQATKT